MPQNSSRKARTSREQQRDIITAERAQLVFALPAVLTMATTAFEVDSWVWMPDDDEMYLPAKVHKAGFNKGDEGKVKTEDGETHTLSAKVTADLMPCNEEVLSSEVDNLIKLDLSAATSLTLTPREPGHDRRADRDFC